MDMKQTQLADARFMDTELETTKTTPLETGEDIRDNFDSLKSGTKITVEDTDYTLKGTSNWTGYLLTFKETDDTLNLLPEVDFAFWSSKATKFGEESDRNPVNIPVKDLPEEYKISLSDIIIGDRDLLVSNSRECPECGNTGAKFKGDNVPRYIRSIETLPEIIEEEAQCINCDTPYLIRRESDIDSTATIQTRPLSSANTNEGELSGLYKLKDTCLRPFARGTNEYAGLWTAEEVAHFIEGRHGPNEDGEWNGFASIKSDGEVTWVDDQPYSLEKRFVPITEPEE